MIDHFPVPFGPDAREFGAWLLFGVAPTRRAVAGIFTLEGVLGGLLAVMLDNIVSAVVSAGLASLFASVVYVVLAAPDVAMTEASIGSGLTTMIFLYAIRKTRGDN